MISLSFSFNFQEHYTTVLWQVFRNKTVTLQSCPKNSSYFLSTCRIVLYDNTRKEFWYRYCHDAQLRWSNNDWQHHNELEKDGAASTFLELFGTPSEGTDEHDNNDEDSLTGSGELLRDSDSSDEYEDPKRIEIVEVPEVEEVDQTVFRNWCWTCRKSWSTWSCRNWSKCFRHWQRIEAKGKGWTCRT